MLANRKGFSLVEMLVVITIIAILSSIAIPAYQTFISKARQKEGFALMNTYFAAAQAAKAEFGDFPGNFVQSGFAPTGRLGYRLRADDGPDVGIPWNDNACIHTSNALACNCGGACGSFKTWTEAPGGTIGGNIGPSATTAPACGAVAARGVTANTFSIRVAGIISSKAAQRDQYAMDHTKQVAMCTDGLK